MSLKKRSKFPKKLSSRLILWYTLVFSMSSILIFLLLYFVLSSQIGKEMDDELVADLKEYQKLLTEKRGDFDHRAFIESESESHGSEKVFYRIFHHNAQIFLVSNLTLWNSLGKPDDAIAQLDTGAPYYFENVVDEHHKLIGRSVYGKINDDLLMQIGMSVGDQKKLLQRLKNIFVISLIIINFYAALFGFFLIRKSLAGVHEVTRAAHEISKSGNLEKRVSIKDYGEEIEKLSYTFNTMLDRIEQLVACIKDMTDNIAHDLRSPISRIRTITELTLINDQSLAEYKNMACETIEECDRIMNMVNSILDMTEAKAGTTKMELADIDFADIIADACELFEPVAEEKEITLHFSTQKACRVRGNVQSLQRLVANLIDNAIKYTEPGGTVDVTLFQTNQEINALFKDNGTGIAADDLPYIFDRFYRCDKSRSESGFGLGLSLARIIAHHHAGDITVNSEPGIGTEFVLTLPGL